MGKVIVPMQYKLDALHLGHVALINRANEMGDATLLVYPKSQDLLNYCLGTGAHTTVPHTLVTLGKEAVARKVKIEIIEFPPMPIERRVTLFTSATKFVENCGLDLPKSVCGQCAMALVHVLYPVYIRGHKERDPYIPYSAVRGPDISAFFVNKYRNLFSQSYNLGIEIIPSIIKDPAYGIKAQDSFNLLTPYQQEAAKRLRYMIGGLRPRMKLGDNVDLVKEIMLSYPHRPWKLVSATLLEGGIVPGRLEIYRFYMLDQKPYGRKVNIEEVFYNA